MIARNRGTWAEGRAQVRRHVSLRVGGSARERRGGCDPRRALSAAVGNHGSFLSQDVAFSGLTLRNPWQLLLAVSKGEREAQRPSSRSPGKCNGGLHQSRGLGPGACGRRRERNHVRGITEEEAAESTLIECAEQEEGGDKELSGDGRFSCPLLIPRTFPEHLQRVRPSAIQAGN